MARFVGNMAVTKVLGFAGTTNGRTYTTLTLSSRGAHGDRQNDDLQRYLSACRVQPLDR